MEIPDPLITSSGDRIKDAVQWESLRRPEILGLFREHIYGRNAVERPSDLRFEILEEAESALEGRAIRRVARIVYSGAGGGEASFKLTVYYPKDVEPKTCFLLIGIRAPELITEAETNPTEFWPVRDLIERGCATAAFYYGDVAADDAGDDFKSGVFRVFDPSTRPRAADAWGAIAAWAWGFSRAVDFLVTEPRLKNVPIAAIGHSRGGKAALWCAAQDSRIAMVVSNNSGCAGAALQRVMRGESVHFINTHFPHWFARNYHACNDSLDGLPVDQHFLIALIAPRLVYVASASEDAHAGPEAEFQSCVEAGRVYALYGKQGVGDPVFPAVGEVRHEGAIGYHLRAGGHGLKREDWVRYMDFADKALCRERK